MAGQPLSSFGDTALYLTLGSWAKALTGSNATAGLNSGQTQANTVRDGF